MVIWSAISSVKAVETIKKTKQPKLDLEGRFIHLIAGIPPNRKISDCSLNEGNLLTHPELCMLRILEKQINFTTEPFPERPKYFQLTLYNIQADNFVNNVIISKDVPGLQWLPHGVNFEPYKLILISKLQSVNVDSLLQPFDRNIWMALLVANSLFLIVVSISFKFKKKRQLVLWMISTTVSQADEYLTMNLFDKKRLINFTLVSSWFFLMFLLNMLYQGDLYSCLSSVRLPVLPNSLSETLITGTPLFTIGESCRHSETDYYTPKCSSTLLSTLIPDILKTKEADEILRNVASKVLNRTESIPGNPVFIALEMALSSVDLQTLGKDWITPNTFGVLSPLQETEEFKAAAQISFKDYIIRQTNDIIPFIIITPWMAQRGLFATAVSSGIGSLSQSGLAERWRKHFLNGKVMHLIKTKFKSMHDLENKLIDGSTLEQQLSRSIDRSYKWEGSGRLYSRFMLVSDTNLMLVSSVQPVPLEVMELPFLACLVLSSVSFVVFLIEFVTFVLKAS
jgi:hypothetical protein